MFYTSLGRKKWLRRLILSLESMERSHSHEIPAEPATTGNAGKGPVLFD